MIFISYRIADSNTAATLLERELKRVFGENVVFRDKTGIEGGDPWRKKILKHVTECCAMLVVIGKEWRTVKCEGGKLDGFPRLHNPDDWVRLEISTALKAEKTLIPIRLDGVPMPDGDWLGNVDLQGLSDFQGNVLRTDDFKDDFDKLVALLRKKCPELRTKKAPRNTKAQLAPTKIPPTYIEWLTDQCTDIVPFAMEPAQGLSVCLKDVYVPPLTSPRHDRTIDGLLPDSKGGKRRQREPKQPAATKGNGEENKPQLLLSVLGENSLYVSGDPGTGKTTFCRWVGWLAATGQEPKFLVDHPEYHETLPTTLRGKLPVLVRLSELGDYFGEKPAHSSTPQRRSRAKPAASKLRSLGEALNEWVTATTPGGLTWNDVKSHLDHGSLLLILDGVDEVPLGSGDDASGPSPRELFLTALSNAAPEWIKLGNRILITSRPYGLEPDQVRQLERAGLPEARLEPLPLPLQDMLATRWFVALSKTPAKGREVAAAMLKQARGLSEDVAAMTANPLLLTAICVIYSSGKELPQDRHHLYDRIVETALYSRFPRDKNLIARVRGRLAAIALGMHTGQPIEPGRKSPAREVHHVELDAILDDYIKENPEIESSESGESREMRVIKAREELLNFSGLLSSSRSQHAAFSHWSFQEFLAAERMTTICKASEAQLFKKICEWSSLVGWRPTLSFLFDRRVAQLGWQSGTPLLKKMVTKINKRSIAGSIGLACCASDAMGILLDRKLTLQEDLLAPFRTICLAAIDQEAELKPRIDLARTLGHIGDPRISSDIHDEKNWVTVEAGPYFYGEDKRPIQIEQPFRLSKYLVTNAQFAGFVKASGYKEQSLWDQEGWEWRQACKIEEPRFWEDPKWNGSTQPVVGVSWFEADAFCRWADCRLPTEQEWEAAARGPKGNVYPWGDEWIDGICNTGEAELRVTTPVGSFPSSVAKCGAHDMAGNVWEWCASWWDEKKKEFRVVRGGSWSYDSWYARSAVRYWYSPVSRGLNFGFRVVSLRQDS